MMKFPTEWKVIKFMIIHVQKTSKNNQPARVQSIPRDRRLGSLAAMSASVGEDAPTEETIPGRIKSLMSIGMSNFIYHQTRTGNHMKFHGNH